MNEAPEKVTHLPAPLVVREPAPMMPVSLADIQRMATAVAQSGLFGVKTPEQAMALMLVAQAEGLHPAIAARDYDIIQGRPAKKSEAMMRSFIANGGRVRWLKLDDTCAEATFSHAQGGEVTIKWDIPRAATAGLTSKDMYKKYPRQMLRARCISEGVRTVCPMATSGMYVPEEVLEMEPHTPTGAQTASGAVAGSQPQDTEERRALLARFEQAAGKGVAAYAEAWKAATKDERTLIGTTEHNRLKAIAEAVKEESHAG